MIKNRRGIETVVAWVLLLGFSVTLGIFVFMWATKSTEKMTESTLEFVAGGLECEQVQIYAVFDPRNPSDLCGYVNITNRGYLNITQIMTRGDEQSYATTSSNSKNRHSTKAKGGIHGWNRLVGLSR